MIKMRSSTKIFIGFIAIVGACWFGYNKIQDQIILGQKFNSISPKQVNIVGITPAGYRIIISNEVAQLVETQGDFQANQSDDEGGGDDSGGSIKKKISVKDMLGTLAGSSKSLSAFLMSMNDFTENDLPPIRVVWTKDDIKRALAGDGSLRKKLESDLNMHLDGTPLSTLNINSLQNGIVLQVPVTLQVALNGQLKPVTGNLLIPYKPRMIKAVEADYADQGKVDATVITGHYKAEAEKTLDKKKSREDIREVLEDNFSENRAKGYAQYPEKILSTAFVVINSDYIKSAHYTTYTAPNGKPLYDLHISLNDEGRRRLWQYTRNRVGDQILLASNGVAIAAARIVQPLIFGEVTITHMTDQTLLDDLIATIKTSKGEKMAEK